MEVDSDEKSQDDSEERSTELSPEIVVRSKVMIDNGLLVYEIQNEKFPGMLGIEINGFGATSLLPQET